MLDNDIYKLNKELIEQVKREKESKKRDKKHEKELRLLKDLQQFITEMLKQKMTTTDIIKTINSYLKKNDEVRAKYGLLMVRRETAKAFIEDIKSKLKNSKQL